jgi:hypothetical protein
LAPRRHAGATHRMVSQILLPFNKRANRAFIDLRYPWAFHLGGKPWRLRNFVW